MNILTDVQTQVNKAKKADETAVSTPPQRRVNDDEREARRKKLAAMSLDQFNDALFG